VLACLPAQGLTRAQLAAETQGDAHALDDGQPLATLVLACAPEPEEDPDIESRRARWARWGVLVNELARPVLHLNLPTAAAPDAGPCPGEPAYASLRQLLRVAPVWAVEQRTVFVCENPNVVAIAADRLGGDCAPLVCTDGMPAAAPICAKRPVIFLIVWTNTATYRRQERGLVALLSPPPVHHRPWVPFRDECPTLHPAPARNDS
jgi:uncharacterized protein (TIGR02679 family)